MHHPAPGADDAAIRRTCAGVGLLAAAAALALAPEAALALRMGAQAAALLTLGLLLAAWRVPHRTRRHGRLRQHLRPRLLWHAERVALAALALWAATLALPPPGH
ncbi:hypothetical protein ACI6QG_09055 [Roseococcus sp. DSY-14]|uniref:hypothetical protein n=1 Tax=Roseococcus sp. DSY-14 TaxID=3369650 RepID=UPI00387B03C2